MRMSNKSFKLNLLVHGTKEEEEADEMTFSNPKNCVQ